MDAHLTEKLAQYGALGVLLAVFVTLFVWMFKTLFSKFLQQMDTLTATQKEMVTALNSLNASADHNHHVLKDEMNRNHVELLNQLARGH